MSNATPPPASSTTRRWWLALTWSLLAPGLGQAYCGHPVRGLAFCGGFWLTLLALTSAGYRLLHHPLLLLLLLALPLLVWFWAHVDAVRVTTWTAGLRAGLSRWNVCLGLGLAHGALLVSLLFPPGISLIPAVPDLVEVYPTDQNAVSGAGGLTVGVSSAGTLTMLRWPGPAGRDHVQFRSAAGLPPGVGARENMGVFAGVVVGTETYWFRGATFETTQRYPSDESDVIVTEHVSQGLQLRATETLFVHPEQDLLTWTVRLERLPGGPERVRLVWHENLAPCTWKLPYLPLSDWALDDSNDFAAAHHAADDVLVHFRPNADAEEPDAPADVDAWVEGLDAEYGEGVYLALALASGSGDVLVAPDPQRGGRPESLLRTSAGAPLGSGRFAAGAAVGFLSRDLLLARGPAEETLYLAAGPSLDGPGGARPLLQAARSRSPVAHREAAEAEWSAWLKRARLPDCDEPAVLRLAKRSLLCIRNACDRGSGAIVASVATQLPYALDWARDGAFINLALDEAGYPELVSEHNDYYARVQRQDGLLAGSYPMNTYEDGTPGGPIFLEIDNTALAVCTLANHARFLEGEERRAYLKRVGPAIVRGAEFLVRWRDPLTGLHLPAHEDDDPTPTRGIQGAATTILALRAAELVSPSLGLDPEVSARWQVRRTELTEAALSRFWDASAGRFVDGSRKELDASAWALWPCELFPPHDPRAKAQGRYLWSQLQKVLRGETPRSGYDAKLFLALAWLWGPDHPQRPALRAAFLEFARKLPSKGTGLVSEHYLVHKGPDGAIAFELINDMPHVWEHSLLYLAALRLFPPKEPR